MKKEYVFPYNNWYLKFDECDRELVDNWRINIVKYSNNPCPSNYINYKGHAGPAGWLAGGVLITIDQFKQYVLNIQEPIINENYDYLIPILSKII